MKSFRNLLLLGALLLAGQFGASAQVYDWASQIRQFGGGTNNSSPDYFNLQVGAGATDAAGNTYTTIYLKDSVRIGTQLLRASAGNQALIKYDSTGQVQWVKQLRNLVFDNQSVAVSPSSGAVFVFAYAEQQGTLPTWGGATIATGGQAGFFARVSSAGTLMWVHPLPLLPFNPRQSIYNALGLTADDQDNCYIMNRVKLPTTLGGVALDSTSSFLMKADGSGTISWVRQFQARQTTPAQRYSLRLRGLGPKPGGGCFVVSWGAIGPGALYYGPTANIPLGNVNSDFVSNIDAAGNMLWTNSVAPLAATNGGLGDFFAATADAAGNCYATGNFGPGLGVVKYNAAGVVQWARSESSPGPGFNGEGTHIVVDGAGNSTVLCRADFSTNNGIPTPPYVIGNLTLRSLLNVVRFDPNGVAQWSVGDVPGPIIQFPRSQAPAYGLGDGASLGVDRRGNLYYSSMVLVADTFLLGGGQPAVQLGPHTLVGRGVAVMRIGTRHNLLTGRTYLDLNGNGQPDPGEGPLPYPLVLQATQANLTSYGSADASGRFLMSTDSGAYQLTTTGLPSPHYVRTQPSGPAYNGNFAHYGLTDSLRHFGFRPVPNQVDLRTTLTAYTAARRGVDVRYRLTLENVGTTTIPAGTATVTLDPQMTFVGSYPATTLAGRVVRWNYPAILPLSRRTLDITTRLPTTIPLGTDLLSAADASVVGDVLPADNSSALSQLVVGSLDPNDITVSYAQLSPAQVAARQPLDYTVRFQNLGTDTAFAVVVTDTLDFHKLDLSTLQLVAESHPCTWSLSGTGRLTVRFLAIGLPHQAQDEVGSHGFVRFRVLPKTSLALGDLVRNKADVFFDYNAPVRTNTATTAVLMPAALAADARATAFAAYPNPARETVSVAAELPTAGTVRVSLLDALGRTVLQQQISAPAGPLRHTLALGSLRPGLYVLRLQLPDGRSTSQRLVIE